MLKKAILSYTLLFSINSLAITNGQTLKVEHGDLRVVYTIVDDYQHVLKVLKKINKKINGKDLYKQLQVVDIKLKESEYLSTDKSFECFSKNKQYVYGVINSKIAKESTPFSPLRAWVMKEKDLKLEKVVNPYAIKCTFKSGEEKDYPFPPE